jgi:hypothetical protein
MSKSEKPLDAEMAAIEAALGSLTPAASGIARDRLMFLAGRASVGAEPACRRRASRSRVAWVWPCTTTASLLAAFAFAALWISLPPSPFGRDAGGDGIRSRTIDVADNPPARSFGQSSDARREVADRARAAKVGDVAHSLHHNYLLEREGAGTLFLTNRQLCQLVLEKGIDALRGQETSGSRVQAVSSRQSNYRDLRRCFFDGSSI